MAESTPVRRKRLTNLHLLTSASPSYFSKGNVKIETSTPTAFSNTCNNKLQEVRSETQHETTSITTCFSSALHERSDSASQVNTSPVIKNDCERTSFADLDEDDGHLADLTAFSSPNIRRWRIRTLEHNPKMTTAIDASSQATKTINPMVIASSERMKRNTDSMIEDVIIAQKLKQRLAARWEGQQLKQEKGFIVSNTALSDFITQQISRGGKINAEAAARPTTECISNAADMAQRTIMEGYFTSLEDEATSQRVRKLFIESVQREEYNQGDIIFQQNDAGDRLFVIEEGAVQFLIGEQVAGIAGAGSVFGELSLVYGLPRQMTVQVTTPCFIAWTIHDLAFRRIQAAVANKSLKRSSKIEQQNDHSASKSKILQRLRRQASSMRDEQEKASNCQMIVPVTLDSLVKETVLGKGTFGLVFLVTTKTMNKSSNDNENPSTACYGLKRMSKKAIEKRGNQKRVLIEKNALQSMTNCPFVVKLFGTYQDKDYIYFLTEFVQGGNLISYMIQRGTLTHSESLFFCGCIACALIHVHKMGFVHRDVKPENCLIAVDGSLKLCDFGMAKRLPSTIRMQNGGTEVVTLAFTMCGTPEFMAPEYILSTGYNKGVDWWALGCILVEMYTGQSPFEFGGDLKCTFKEVCLIGMERKEFNPPLQLKKSGMENASSFVKGLLRPMTKRLGRDDDMEILHHQYFAPLNIDDLQANMVGGPYTPHVAHPADTCHFKNKYEDIDDECEPYEGDQDWCRDF